MKRNIGIIILLIAQLLKNSGVDLNIGQTEIDTLISGGGVLLATIGTIHSFIRKWLRAQAAKKLGEPGV